MKFTCINIQGNLISEEVLTKVGEATSTDQQPKDFGLPLGSNLRDEIEYAWSRIKLDYKHFADRSQNASASDPYGTTLARRWMEQFFTCLGFDLEKHRSNLVGENKQEYNISHSARSNDGLPVSIVGFFDPNHADKNTLDIKSSGGTSRLSPHGTVQEYLNVTGHVYGFTSNGFSLRLIRDSGRLVKLSYIEFDLRRMLEEDRYSEFAVLYRLLHSSRFPSNMDEASSSPIEKYYRESIETGNRIRDGLSLAVKESMVALGKGFLQHPQNENLRDALRTNSLTPKQYYDQLRRLIYRLLFLMVTEERDLIYDPEDKSEETAKKKRVYSKYYSIARLRKLSQNRYLYESQFTDVWQGLTNTFNLFEAGGSGLKLNIKPLAGDLFGYEALKDIYNCSISNVLMLECLRNLNEFEYRQTKTLVPINYRSLDVEELGSVYEGLLELHPVIENLEESNPAHINFTFHEGTDRKTTGSYYTRPELVNELIKSALIAVIEERLNEHTGNKEAQTKALLKLKVCDAAAGSGHMLLAVARTIAWYLARVQSGEENPAPSVYRKCLREVIQHCIYAVDFNPDAVELCKLALWLEGHNSGKPLSFLDHKIRNGNSLVGVIDLSVLQKGIPDDAFNPVTGDDKKVCQELKKENAKYNKTKQGTLDFDQGGKIDTKTFTGDYKELENLQQDDIDGVKKVRTKFEKLRSNHAWFNDWRACNLWTAAFFWNYTEENKQAAPNSERIAKFLTNPAAAYGPMIGKADALSMEHKFFHWPLEFPDVFDQGGFDVMLGNPPWERIKLQQQEFFATRSAEIANAANAAARDRLINALPQTNPELFKEYESAVHTADATGKFLRASGRCQLTAVGDINTYSIFSELTSSLVNKNGRTGIIVPTGIATDDSNKAFFGAMVENNRLVSLFDFENREKIFQDVDSRYKFCLLTLSTSDIGKQKARFGFFLTRVEHLQDEMRVFSLSKDDFLRLNPNTKTCPVFRTRIDAELTTKIYQRVPVLINEETGENPWGVSFMRMFDMSNDSHLFRTRQQLEAEGFTLWGNKIKRSEEVWLPLYEAKMIWHYDHRFGSYAGVDSRTSTQTPTPTLEQYQDPNYQILPWYWVAESKVKEITEDKWFIGFRNVARATDIRTGIFSLIPISGVGNSMPVMFSNKTKVETILLNSIISSIVFDFVTRQKIAGINFNFFYLEQLPVLSISQFLLKLKQTAISFSTELTYTSWDIKSFADDVWKEADDDLKAAIQQQWEANNAATGGHSWAPPDWCELDQHGCPLPPFKWDEERRAVLKAELDAIYAKLYGLTTEELRYILDPQDVYGPDFPGETFRVLKEKEIRQFGEYRTRRLVLEAWERLNAVEGV
jgi:type I restriction-modification system DNA methylase subunit